ncbi:MAG: hypothetical protein JWR88_1117 [Pseudonocardia sp.]|jgi:cold shock CspA family protein|nr:hypothetical protein [Pseudonocardia sp.]
MASGSVGYVSSYDADLGLGYIRPEDDPRSIVLFRESALTPPEAGCITVGQQVTYELAPPSKSSRTPVARRVRVAVQPANDAGEPPTFEAEAL